MTAPAAPSSSSPPLSADWIAAWLEQTWDLLALSDAAGLLQWTHPAFETATGLRAGDDLLSMAPAGPAGLAARSALSSALASGRLPDTDMALRGAAGQPLWVRARVTRRGDSLLWTLQPLRVVGSSLDGADPVAQARRAEQLTQRLESAAEAARIGIWTTVPGTRETEWNSQMYALFDRVDSTSPPSLGDWLRCCVHPSDRDHVADRLRAFMRREVRDIELEFRTPTRAGGMRWMVLRADLDRGGSDPSRVFGIAMDVTERHEALDALHAVSERSALIARHAGIGTWETDPEGNPALWDDQMWHLRGLPPRPNAPNREERLAMVHPDDRFVLLDNQPGIGANTAAYEFRVRLPDGSFRWLASRSAPLLDERGHLLRRVGVNWDITEAKNADMARQQVLLTARESQAKSQFLSRMSHELRTPLNAVLGFTQLLQLEARQGGENGQMARLDHIRAAGEHLLSLIDDALDLSGLQTGTLKLELEPVVLIPLVTKALAEVGPLAASHGVRLQSGALPGRVMADPARLRQVLLNLLTNAIRHNVPGGRVIVESTLEGDQVLLEVRDTGRGMGPEQTAQLFEPFSDPGAKGEGSVSSGIGLAIARALIEGMGGTIRAHSELGQGTVFSLRLPAVPESLPPAPSAGNEPAPAGVARRAGMVLYIEDNSVNVLLVEELVKSLSGLRIVSEATGTGGVARARALRPNLILIDMELPDFNGFEVLRQLRAHPETATIPCIALSANAMPEDVRRGLESGFDDYWTKPIKFRPFLQALEQFFPVMSA